MLSVVLDDAKAVLVGEKTGLDSSMHGDGVTMGDCVDQMERVG